MDMEDFSCALCSSQFDNENKIPLMLSCGHSYCKGCVSMLFESSNLACPEDGTPINTSSVDSLPKNFSLLQILSRMPKKQSLSNTCPAHKRQLEYVCVEDRSRVCAECAIFGGHKGHDIRPLEEVMKEVTLRAECLIDMLQIIEKSQYSVMDDGIKSRLDTLYDHYCRRRLDLEKDLRDGFQKLHKNLKDIESAALTSLQKNFNYIEANIVNIRDMPKLIDSQATNWKNRAKDKLDVINQHSENSNYIAFEILDASCSDLFHLGEKLMVDLEELKDLKVEPLEDLVQGLSVEFSDNPLSNLVQVKALPKYSKLTHITEMRNSLTSEQTQINSSEPSNISSFNEESFNATLEILKSGNAEVADFSGSGGNEYYRSWRTSSKDCSSNKLS